jgi:hypothetical protein
MRMQYPRDRRKGAQPIRRAPRSTIDQPIGPPVGGTASSPGLKPLVSCVTFPTSIFMRISSVIYM